MKSSVWTTRDGDQIKYCDLETDHLQNILKLIERKADEGMEIRWGVCDSFGIDGGCDIISGGKVLERFNYYGLKKELDSRSGK